MVFFTLGTIAFAEIENAVGTKAPEIEVKKWIFREPANPENPFEGKNVWLEFINSTCPPCEESLPRVDSLVSQFGGDDIIFTLISDEPETILNTFARKFGPEAYVAMIDFEIKEKFQTNRMPEVFLIDKSGTIAWRGHPQDFSDDDMRLFLEKGIVPIGTLEKKDQVKEIYRLMKAKDPSAPSVFKAYSNRIEIENATIDQMADFLILKPNGGRYKFNYENVPEDFFTRKYSVEFASSNPDFLNSYRLPSAPDSLFDVTNDPKVELRAELAQKLAKTLAFEIRDTSELEPTWYISIEDPSKLDKCDPEEQPDIVEHSIYQNQRSVAFNCTTMDNFLEQLNLRIDYEIVNKTDLNCCFRFELEEFTYESLMSTLQEYGFSIEEGKSQVPRKIISFK